MNIERIIKEITGLIAKAVSEHKQDLLYKLEEELALLLVQLEKDIMENEASPSIPQHMTEGESSRQDSIPSPPLVGEREQREPPITRAQLRPQVERQRKDFFIKFCEVTSKLQSLQEPFQGILSAKAEGLNNCYVYPNADPAVVEDLYKTGCLKYVYIDPTLKNISWIPAIFKAALSFKGVLGHTSFFLHFTQVIPAEKEDFGPLCPRYTLVELRLGKQTFYPLFQKQEELEDMDELSLIRAKQTWQLCNRILSIYDTDHWHYPSESDAMIISYAKKTHQTSDKIIKKFMMTNILQRINHSEYGYECLKQTRDENAIKRMKQLQMAVDPTLTSA